MFTRPLCTLLVAALAGCAAKPAPVTPASSDRFGVLVMAHGGSPEWNAAVAKTIEPLRAKYDIEIAFGMADATTMQEAVKKLEARNVHKIGVVRLFVSGESWFERTQQIFGLRDGAPPAGEHAGHDMHAMQDPHAGHAGHNPHAGAAPAGAHGGHSMAFFRVASQAAFELSTQGLADAEGMGKVLADRAKALSKDPAKEDILILAHGPGDDAENTRWIAKLDSRAAAIRALAPFRRVEVATLREDWPDKRAPAEETIRAFVSRAKAEGGSAIVLPFRVQGFGPYAQVLQGLDYVSDSQGLIPHEEVEKWIEAQVVELAARPFATPRTSTSALR
jgi:hypothetical protein